jgi:hypothetical protein
VIRVHAATFFVLLELLLIAVGVVVFLLVRQRRLRRTAPPASAARHEPSAGEYLLAEEDRTRARIAMLISDTNLDDRDEDAVAALALRADYLHVERELATVTPRDEAFWQMLDRRTRELRARHPGTKVKQESEMAELHAVPEQADSSNAQDAAKLQELIQSQDGTIRNLKQRLDDAIGDDLTRQELHREIDRLTHVNREMSACIKVLEDESEFLRRQISELVKPGNGA